MVRVLLLFSYNLGIYAYEIITFKTNTGRKKQNEGYCIKEKMKKRFLVDKIIE